MDSCDLSSSKFNDVDFSGADIRCCSLLFADFSYASFKGARLDGSLFIPSNIEGSDLTESQVENCFLMEKAGIG